MYAIYVNIYIYIYIVYKVYIYSIYVNVYHVCLYRHVTFMYQQKSFYLTNIMLPTS